MNSARTIEWPNAPALAHVCSHSTELSFSRNRHKERCAQEAAAALLYNAARVAGSRGGQVASNPLLVDYFDSSAEKLHGSRCPAKLPLTIICKQKSEECLQDFTLGLREFTRGRRKEP